MSNNISGTAIPLGSESTRTILGEPSTLPRTEQNTGIRIGGSYTTYTAIGYGRIGQQTEHKSWHRQSNGNGGEGFLARRFGRR